MSNQEIRENSEIILASRPKGLPDLSTFKFRKSQPRQLQDGDVKVRGLYYSVDPYMRGRMNAAKSYAPPFKVDEPINGGVVAQVTDSKSKKFAVGDIVLGMMPWAQVAVINESGLQKIPQKDASLYLGLLGMPGMTAYFGLGLAKPKPAETVVISGAAGAVGMAVGQIAKIRQCRVVGIAGTDEKCQLLKSEFGFTEVVNYKTAKDLHEALQAACPKGVDVYFDNVGAEVSDAVLPLMNEHGRITICGQIALYNSEKPPMGPRIEPLLLTRKLTMRGFIVSDYQEHFPEAQEALVRWHSQGLIKAQETKIDGFERLPKALLGLFSGQNTGKMIVHAGDPQSLN